MKISKILDLARYSALDEWAKENRYLEMRPESKLAQERTRKAWDRMEELENAACDIEALERGLERKLYGKGYFNTEVIKRLEKIEWRYY